MSGCVATRFRRTPGRTTQGKRTSALPDAIPASVAQADSTNGKATVGHLTHLTAAAALPLRSCSHPQRVSEPTSERNPIMFAEVDGHHIDGFVVSLEWHHETEHTLIVIDDDRTSRRGPERMTIRAGSADAGNPKRVSGDARHYPADGVSVGLVWVGWRVVAARRVGMQARCVRTRREG